MNNHNVKKGDTIRLRCTYTSCDEDFTEGVVYSAQVVNNCRGGVFVELVDDTGYLCSIYLEVVFEYQSTTWESKFRFCTLNGVATPKV